jgi:hypothetical protein
LQNKITGGAEMMGRVYDLLKGSFWKLDLSRVQLSRLELDFLKVFFDITVDHVVNDWSIEERSYLVLKKKQKYISNLYLN